jgi:hypothetical protein
MLAFYCQQCGALDEKGARGHRCASTKTVASTVAITNAITNAEPAKLTPKQRAAAWSVQPQSESLTLAQAKRVELKLEEVSGSGQQRI